jgi:hypothetical protein
LFMLITKEQLVSGTPPIATLASRYPLEINT